MDDIVGRLRCVAQRLASASETEASIAGICGYLLGATYSLLRAHELGFMRGNTVSTEYVNELRQVGEALAAGADPGAVAGTRLVDGCQQRGDHVWLAGFYFNSGLHRLAAAADRMGARRKHDVQVPDVVDVVYREVNKLKHDEEGLVPARSVLMADALAALEYLAKRYADASQRR